MSADMYIHFFFLIHSGSHRLMLTKVLCKIFVRYANIDLYSYYRVQCN